MRSIPATCSLALLLLVGCNYSNSNNPNTSNSTNNSNTTISSNTANSSSTSGAAKAKGDFSTPKAAVDTFITAAERRDVDLLSQCFDADSAGEFRKLREKTASQKELDDLATFAQGAQVVDVKEKGDRALVSVKFKERNEEIAMKKSAGGWKILDF